MTLNEPKSIKEKIDKHDYLKNKTLDMSQDKQNENQSPNQNQKSENALKCGFQFAKK